jgi:vacuolar-type H+-ATPase subunit F/Vma7
MIMVGDKYLASGFRLIGIPTQETLNDEDSAEKVRQIVSQDTAQIIITTEKVASKVTALRQNLLKMKKPYPLFVIIPDFEGPTNERINELYKLVNQATGIKPKTK